MRELPLHGDPERVRVPLEVTLARLLLLCLVLVAAATALLQVEPADLRLVPCPVRALAGVPCPGCGTTRASVSLLRGDAASALRLQPLVLPLLPLLAIFAVLPRRSRRLWSALAPGTRRALLGISLALCLGLWVLRLA